MKKLVLTLVICLGCTGILGAQNIWKPINVPGTLLGVSSDGSIFAYIDYFDYGEIARSQDEGETWQVVFSSETEPDISFLYNMEHGFTISEDGRAFVVTEHQEEGYLDYYCLFYSDDNGDTWQQTTEIPFFLASGMVEFGGIAAPTNDIIVAWSSGGDYIWTIDGGATWSSTSWAPPHDGIPGHLPHELCDVIVNASGDLYASYLLYSDRDAAVAQNNVSHMSSWGGLGTFDCTVIWDMEFGSDDKAYLGYIKDTTWTCGDVGYLQGDRYYVFAGQSIAVSDNGIVYRLRYIDDTHVVLNYSQNNANSFFDVGEAMEIHQPYSSLFHDGNIYKGKDNYLYFHGNGQYRKSIPNANDIPSLNGWIGTCFFDEASNLWYVITDNNTVEVTTSQGNPYQGSFAIPETVSYMGTTYTVVGIGNWSFRGSSGVTFIGIPETVTYIGDEAFYYCTGLDSINIPNSMVSIGEKAFFTCESLESIYIPNSVTSIGTSAFRECFNLKSVHLPDSLEVIKPYLFYLCYELQSITLPESLKEIKRDAFYNCTQLSEIVIPKNVERIDVEAFWWCSNLSRIELGQSVNYIGDAAFLSYGAGEIITVICHNPIPAQCSTTAFPGPQYQEKAIVPCGCEEAYRSAWAECWQSGNFEEDCAGIDSEWCFAGNQFTVYPNPTDGVLFVETRRATSLQDQTYRITNLMGQTLMSGTITAETQQIDVTNLPEGLYFITFAGETRKFVVSE